MTDIHLYLAFIVATVVLMLIPGPNVALIVANSVAHGARYGLMTMAGTASAMIVQLTLTAFGMAKLLGTPGSWFEALRWIGVAYLFYLGITQWRAAPVDLSGTRSQPKAPRAIFVRALLVSVTNPKTLFFLAAFFPQFVSPAHEAGAQVVVLSVTFLVVAVIIDSGWALAAARARRLVARRGTLRNRLSGGLLMGAGVGLAAARMK